MKTIGDYITHASRQLNDQKKGHAFTRWGRALLLDYLNRGLSELAALRPEDFLSTISVTLKPGVVQALDIEGEIANIGTNADGTPIAVMDKSLTMAFNAHAVCGSNVKFVNGTPTYRVWAIAIDEKDTHKIYVDPPVPTGLNPTISITVKGQNKQYTLSDWDEDILLPSKYQNNLINFIEACAFRLDNESANSRANSDSLFKQFYNSLGIKYIQQAKYDSGKYSGNDRAVTG